MNVQTNTGDGKVLINFRVPVSLKKSFDEVCRYTSLNRSNVLLNFMTNYVQTQGNEIHNQIKDQNKILETFSHGRRTVQTDSNDQSYQKYHNDDFRRVKNVENDVPRFWSDDHNW